MEKTMPDNEQLDFRMVDVNSIEPNSYNEF